MALITRTASIEDLWNSVNCLIISVSFFMLSVKQITVLYDWPILHGHCTEMECHAHFSVVTLTHYVAVLLAAKTDS